MIRKMLLILLLVSSWAVSAQSDKDAEDLLKRVINKISSYDNFRAELSYTMVNQEMDIDLKKTGVILVQGDKYRIEMEGQVIMSDGDTMWTYLVDSEEVMISEVEDDEESISPTKILTTYDDNYKAKFDPDNKYKNSDLKLVNLKANEGKQFEHLSLLLNSKNLNLESFSVYDKNGNVFTYHIINLTPHVEILPHSFVFDPALYKVLEVVDMR